jgi:DNA repair exonuclease SbcCD ATPase subunit
MQQVQQQQQELQLLLQRAQIMAEINLDRLTASGEALTTQIEQSRAKIQQLEQYIKLMSPSRIPIRILEQQITYLQTSINTILNSMSELTLKLTLRPPEEDTSPAYLETQINKHHSQLSNHRISGYERFVMQFAIKFSLTAIGIIHTPRFLCIDEGLDCIDHENWPKVVSFFQSLCRSHYQHILVITHLTTSDLSVAATHHLRVQIKGTHSHLQS